MSSHMKVRGWSSRIGWHRARITVAMAMVATAVVAAAQSPPAQTYTVLHKFTGGADGSEPRASTIGDTAGNLYGTTQIGGPKSLNCGTVFKLNPTGMEKVLYSFCGTKADGADPDAPVIRDKAGNLYGTTATGGASRLGTVFRVSNAGKKTTLYSFNGVIDQPFPESGLIRDAAGNSYGTTQGNFDQSQSGTVFKLDKMGHLTVLHTFNGGDGEFPNDLVRDQQGNLFGTTFSGGTGFNTGVVFKLDPAGSFTVLHNFAGGADGWSPGTGSLLLDAAGNLFGTTYNGGTSKRGTVFKIDQNGTHAVLYNFTGGADGGSPVAQGLVQDGAGNLYGTTSFGGNSACQPPFGCGVVFKLSPSGQETVLHSFAGGAADGSEPIAGLFRDAAGNLFGTTLSGGGTTACSGSGCGVVFTDQMTRCGKGVI